MFQLPQQHGQDPGGVRPAGQGQIGAPGAPRQAAGGPGGEGACAHPRRVQGQGLPPAHPARGLQRPPLIFGHTGHGGPGQRLPLQGALPRAEQTAGLPHVVPLGQDAHGVPLPHQLAQQVPLSLHVLRGEQKQAVVPRAGQHGEQGGEVVPRLTAEGQIGLHLGAAVLALIALGGLAIASGAVSAGGGLALVVVPETAVDEIPRRVDELGVGQDHGVALDADQVGLVHIGELVIGIAQPEKVAHLAQGDVGPAVPQNGPGEVGLAGDVVPAGALV